jgi:hypothetical protein
VLMGSRGYGRGVGAILRHALFGALLTTLLPLARLDLRLDTS